MGGGSPRYCTRSHTRICTRFRTRSHTDILADICTRFRTRSRTDIPTDICTRFRTRSHTDILTDICTSFRTRSRTDILTDICTRFRTRSRTDILTDICTRPLDSRDFRLDSGRSWPILTADGHCVAARLDGGWKCGKCPSLPPCCVLFARCDELLSLSPPP